LLTNQLTASQFTVKTDRLVNLWTRWFAIGWFMDQSICRLWIFRDHVQRNHL